MVREEAWLNSKRVIGEFNPTVASLTVLQTRNRLAVPLKNWETAGVHHLSNKYIQAEISSNSLNTKTSSLRFDELAYIFSNCIQRNGSRPQGVHVSGDCLSCIRKTGAARVVTSFQGPAHSTKRSIRVEYQCWSKRSVKFKGYKESLCLRRKRACTWYEYWLSYAYPLLGGQVT